MSYIKNMCAICLQMIMFRWLEVTQTWKSYHRYGSGWRRRWKEKLPNRNRQRQKTVPGEIHRVISGRRQVVIDNLSVISLWTDLFQAAGARYNDAYSKILGATDY
jgi:hypothetical protein